MSDPKTRMAAMTGGNVMSTADVNRMFGGTPAGGEAYDKRRLPDPDLSHQPELG